MNETDGEKEKERGTGKRYEGGRGRERERERYESGTYKNMIRWEREMRAGERKRDVA